MIDIRPTKYTVTGLPEDNEDAYTWALTIEWRGPGDVWAVKKFDAYCLSDTGSWDHEASPSNRTDEYKATHRFPLSTAMELARAAYPALIINGLWVRDGKLVRAIK